MHHIKFPIPIPALAAFLLICQPAAGWAHAYLQKSAPARNETVSAPEILELHFTSAVEPALSELSLQDAANKPMALGKPQGKPADPKALTLKLPKLAPGAYQVKWKVVARDGHPTRGEFGFTVK